MSKYTTILYEVKRELKLSFVEYIYLDTIYHLQAKSGSAYATSDFYCERLEITQRQLSRIKTDLVERGLLEIVPGSNNTKLKVTDTYLRALQEVEGQTKCLPRVDKMSDEGRQNVHLSIENNNRIKKESARRGRALPSLKEKRNPNDDDLFTLEEYISSMRASPQKHIKIIGEYADEKKPDYKTKGQWRTFTKRNLKVAQQLSEFSMDQIADAFEKMAKDIRSEKNPRGFITKWGLETVLKYIIP